MKSFLSLLLLASCASARLMEPDLTLHKAAVHRTLQHLPLDRNLQGDQICALINDNVDEVTCTCESTSITCAFNEEICTGTEPRKTCGRPQFSLNVMDMSGAVKVCILDMTKGLSIQSQDFCITISADTTGMTSCKAELDNRECTCAICDPLAGNLGLEIDCSAVNAEAKLSECQTIGDYGNFFSSISGGSGDRDVAAFRSFLPNWQGVCSKLEEMSTEDAECNCSEAEGDSFNLQCQANRTKVCDAIATSRASLDPKFCGSVTSNVTVVNGDVSSIQACADTPDGKLCGSMTLCADDASICECSVSIDGTACNSCSVCDGGIQLDCSNVPNGVDVDQCQPVTPVTAFSFVPVATERQAGVEGEANPTPSPGEGNPSPTPGEPGTSSSSWKASLLGSATMVAGSLAAALLM